MRTGNFDIDTWTYDWSQQQAQQQLGSGLEVFTALGVLSRYTRDRARQKKAAAKAKHLQKLSDRAEARRVIAAMHRCRLRQKQCAQRLQAVRKTPDDTLFNLSGSDVSKSAYIRTLKDARKAAKREEKAVRKQGDELIGFADYLSGAMNSGADADAQVFVARLHECKAHQLAAQAGVAMAQSLGWRDKIHVEGEDRRRGEVVGIMKRRLREGRRMEQGLRREARNKLGFFKAFALPV